VGLCGSTFCCAAIVLLWTGYSQIKINNYLQEYEDKLHDKENESSMFQYNLSSALAENEKLKKQINELKRNWKLWKRKMNY